MERLQHIKVPLLTIACLVFFSFDYRGREQDHLHDYSELGIRDQFSSGSGL